VTPFHFDQPNKPKGEQLRRLALILLALALTVISVYADDYQDGVNAYESKDYRTAFIKLKPFAEKGDADAQFFLGWMYDSYFDLEDISNKPPEVQEFLEGARDLSSEDLASIRDKLSTQEFLKGQARIGVRKKEAVRWFRLAAQQSHAEAQLHLGVMFAEGKGVPQNYIEAHK